jgi:hypothetical protein
VSKERKQEGEERKGKKKLKWLQNSQMRCAGPVPVRKPCQPPEFQPSNGPCPRGGPGASPPDPLPISRGEGERAAQIFEFPLLFHPLLPSPRETERGQGERRLDRPVGKAFQRSNLDAVETVATSHVPSVGVRREAHFRSAVGVRREAGFGFGMPPTVRSAAERRGRERIGNPRSYAASSPSPREMGRGSGGEDSGPPRGQGRACHVPRLFCRGWTGSPRNGSSLRRHPPLPSASSEASGIIMRMSPERSATCAL